MNTDDLNERCDDKYCTICGPPAAADHALPQILAPTPFVDLAFREYFGDDE